MHISVLGTGYLGATHAACLAALGHTVVGVDADPERAAGLAAGRAPFHEEGLDALLADGLATGRLRFTVDVADAADADVHFLCVGTPEADGGHTDLTAMWNAVDALAPLLDRECLVVGKSTVPVGTAARIRDRLAHHAPAKAGVMVAWNPEFLREGQAVADSLRPDRLVFGVTDDAAHLRLLDVYAEPVAHGVPVIRTDLATAELAKVSANAMLASRVSLVNLLAEVCEVSGADVGDLTQILGSDPRIGSDYLSPGLGYGGGCLPKDTHAFVARAAELGVTEATQLLDAVDAVNTRQRSRTVELAIGLLDDRPAARPVTVLGAAFKAGSDDLRDSPALAVTDALVAAGCAVRVHDPLAGAAVRRARPDLDVVPDARAACVGADLVLVLTDCPEFASLDPAELAGVVGRPSVLDARLVLDPVKWGAAGWDVHALGRGSASGRA